MNLVQAMQVGYEFAKRTGWTAHPRYSRNFSIPSGEFVPLAQAAADYVKWGLTAKQREKIPWLLDWSETWAALAADFEREHELDPAISYVPLAEVHRKFHASTAYIRFFAAGNGTSKSSAGFFEDYLAATGQLWWSRNRGDVCVVGVADKSWGTQVFRPKFLDGEKNNFFSPLFPDGGRWFKRYDGKHNYIELGCPECAAKNRSKQCTHDTRSSKIYAASSETGWESIQGGSFVLGHIDEHAKDEDIFTELKQRTRRGDTRGRIIVTATPLFGEEAWEKRLLWSVWNGDQENNWQNKTKGERWVEIFQCSQYEAGLIPEEEIRASESKMSKTEALARIHGKPVSISEAAVFDFHKLDAMQETMVEEPVRGRLVVKDKDMTLKEVCDPEDLEFREDGAGEVRIWAMPKDGATYLIAADTASGLSREAHDASCSYVLEVLAGTDGIIRLRTVAMWHGWIDPLEYGEEVKKLAVFYNEALVAPETTGGHGFALMIKLTRELEYYNVHQDESPATATRDDLKDKYGIDTGPQSKTLIIAALQRYIHKGWIILKDKDAYTELFAYEQTKSESGKSVRYGGAQGHHDDRVMALALGCYVCVQSPDAVYFGKDD